MVKTLTTESDWEIVNSVSWIGDNKVVSRNLHKWADTKICIWGKDGETETEFYTDYLYTVSWNCKYLAVEESLLDNSNKTIDIYYITSESKIKWLKTLIPDSDKLICSICWSPDDKYLASGNYDGTVKIWDLVSGECIATLKGHTDWVTDVCWCGEYLASSSDVKDNTIKIWDIKTNECVETLSCESSRVSMCWSGNGKLAFSNRNMIKIWNVETKSYEATLNGHTTSITSLSCSRNGYYLASASYDKTIKIWDNFTETTKECIFTLQNENAVSSVYWSPDDKYLASSSEREIKIWDWDRRVLQ